MTLPSARYDFALTASHARAITVLLTLGAGVTGVWAAGRMGFGQAVPVDDARVAAAREFLDPNTASAASLERLPGVGPSRALAVVQYRQDHGPEAFRTAGDLKKVPGVGEGTVRKISPYLSISPF